MWEKQDNEISINERKIDCAVPVEKSTTPHERSLEIPNNDNKLY